MLLKKVNISLIIFTLLFVLLPFNQDTYAFVNEKNVDVPVILIHGYNSDSSSWEQTEFYQELKKMEELKNKGFSVRIVDYGKYSRNDITSQKVMSLISKQIEEATKDCNCEQTDIVVHSMGGLAIRWFLLQDSQGKIEDSDGYYEPYYFKNKIRKVIFLGTPHHGAPVAFVNRLISIMESPKLYYDTKNQSIDNYLKDYIELYQEYEDESFDLWTKDKPISYEQWLQQKHPEVLNKVKSRENEKITPIGDKEDKLGQVRLKTSETYRYSGAFEEYSKIMLGREKARNILIDILRENIKKYPGELNSGISNESTEYLGESEFKNIHKELINHLLNTDAILTVDDFTDKFNRDDYKSTDFENLHGQRGSAHHIVQDRLMSETFNIYTGVATDGNIAYNDVVSNPFLDKLNKEEYVYRSKLFANDEHIPTYITVRTKYNEAAYRWDINDVKDKLVTEATTFMTNIGVWKEEDHDMVVPVSSAQTVPIFLDRNVYYSQDYISHLQQPSSTFLIEQEYLNSLTGVNDEGITYKLNNDLITEESNPILLKIDKNSDMENFNLELKSKMVNKVYLYERDKYGKQIGKRKEVLLSKSGSNQVGYYSFNTNEDKDEEIRELLFVNVNDSQIAKSSGKFTISIASEETSKELSKNKDKMKYTYSITPMETKTEPRKITHKFKLVNNFKDKDESISKLTKKDFILKDINMPDQEKTIYPFYLELEKTMTKKKSDNIVLALDYSNSMRDDDNALEKSKNAAEKYIEKLSKIDNHEVKISTVGFADEPQTFMGFTDNFTLASLSIHKPISGGTALYDTIIFSSEKLSETEGKRTLILLTDGEDSTGGNLEEAIRIAKKHNIIIYLVALGGSVQTDILEQIAHSTGGQVFYTDDATELYNIYNEITEYEEYIFNASFNRSTNFRGISDMFFQNEKSKDKEEYTEIFMTGKRSDKAYFIYDGQQNGVVIYSIEKAINYTYDKVSDKINAVKESINATVVDPVKEKTNDIGEFLKGWVLW